MLFVSYVIISVTIIHLHLFIIHIIIREYTAAFRQNFETLKLSRET